MNGGCKPWNASRVRFTADCGFRSAAGVVGSPGRTSTGGQVGSGFHCTRAQANGATAPRPGLAWGPWNERRPRKNSTSARASTTFSHHHLLPVELGMSATTPLPAAAVARARPRNFESRALGRYGGLR